MFRQHRNIVKEPFSRRVRLTQFKADGVLSILPHRDGFVIDDQQVALRRMQLFVEVDLEAEEDVVGIERLPVGKSNSAAKLEGVMKTVFRNFPRLGESRLAQLRHSINVYEVRSHPANYIAGWPVH